MLTAEGEDFFDLVVQGNVDEQSAEARGDRLRSDMADFVAESRLGWDRTGAFGGRRTIARSCRCQCLPSR
jgi:hypothetical protein